MNKVTRRAVLTGAAAAAAAPSAWATPQAASDDPGFRAFTAPRAVSALPLNEMVETAEGARRIGEWIGRRPAVIALWASWCAPCLIEKPHQAALAQRLAAAGASTRIFALQAYDEGVALDDARWMLDRIHAESLPLARATPAAQVALSRLFNPRTRRVQVTLPSALLIGGDGLEIGRAQGRMFGTDGRGDYWQDEATFRFLSRLN